VAAKAQVPAISPAEYAIRRQAVAAGMEAAGLDAMCVFYPARVAYLTGFHHIPTERPIALVLGPKGFSALLVPAVEKEHAEASTSLERIDVYFEYPGSEHPMERLAAILTEINARPRRTGADHDGYVPRWGYRGPSLSELTGHAPFDAELIVESLRRVKSPTEIACIQLSCDWAVRAHHRMQAAITTGKTEMECYSPGITETMEEMLREMPGWRPRGFEGNGLTAMFVAGRSTAMPHGFVRGHGIQRGDVLVSGAGADIDGYRSELGVADNLRHHVGHAIGLEGHEAPFLDRGDEAVLEAGMVFTVEPGVYIKDLGGFRHSDTVVITDSGCRVMTDYPRELKDLVITP
jgi:Xaa-Pro aminopeptidase